MEQKTKQKWVRRLMGLLYQTPLIAPYFLGTLERPSSPAKKSGSPETTSFSPGLGASGSPG
jgi:hypothetical protein